MAKRGHMWLRRSLIGLLATALVLPTVSAFAEGRPFPVGAKRGVMTPALFPEIEIDGKTRRMSPGGRIFGSNNLIVMSGAIQGSKLAVNYLEDNQGSIQTVWILTAYEAKQAAPKPPPKIQ